MENFDPLESYVSLKYRIAVGLAVLICLAVYDWTRFGRESKRIREYAFIVAVIFATIVYAIVHDLMTSTISPEYFVVGKGLPKDHLLLRAAWVGILAAIGPGALLGSMLIIANNPSDHFSKLRYHRLAQFLIFPLATSILGACICGVLGYYDVRNLKVELVGSVDNPERFLVVWGIHWGTHIGGLVGLCISMILIRRERKRLGQIKNNF